MRQIAPVDIDDTELFLSVVQSKTGTRRQRLRRAESEVIHAYSLYEVAAPEVATLARASLTQHQEAALIHCYDVETVPLRELRGEILGKIENSKCPFCDLNESSTLDHYLPKRVYPEFSILSKNLLPCCSPCNSHKSTMISESGNRLFFHPYFDTIPPHPFLRADVEMHSDILLLNYCIVRPPGMMR